MKPTSRTANRDRRTANRLAIVFMLGAAALLSAACARPSADADPQIRLVHDPGNPQASHISLGGLSRRQQASLRRVTSVADWQRVLSVRVAAGAAHGDTAVAGKYISEGGAITFTPLFPFDPGRQYEVTYDPAALGAAAGSKLVTTVTMPAGPPTAPVHVTQVFPSADILPENQLRMYIHFSGPMGRRGGVEHVKLLDDRGGEVEDPFLPLDAEFWNGDRTRYTLFFDPGRQKRGILPNRQMGPSLDEGRTYTLEVRREWLDGNGRPLEQTFTRRFRVGPPALDALDHTRWRIDAPAEGTRGPLAVSFPAPLDHGLLLRAVGVRRNGQPIEGDVRVEADETRWVMIPREPWSHGQYELVVLSFLEDLAGNRIGRAFEVEGFERADAGPAAETILRSFTLASAR
jgi:hypothetical protein